MKIEIDDIKTNNLVKIAYMRFKLDSDPEAASVSDFLEYAQDILEKPIKFKNVD